MNFISNILKRTILVLPLVRMCQVLLGGLWVLEKERENVCVSGPWKLRLPLEKEGN